MITAALQPTALSIRHSRFATLTLAKLVASLALHPPSSATEADYAPHHRLRRSLSSRRSLLVAVLSNCCQSLCKIFAHNYAPPWHADRRSAQGWRSQTEGEIFKGTDGACADPDTRIFPATVAGDQGHSQFYQLDFYVTTQPSLVLSWAPRKYRNSPSPHAKTAARQYRAAAQCACVWLSSNTPWGR